jgi:His/Glu/Gln/Arg/opine family amino acid ABC transporter permease subunit
VIPSPQRILLLAIGLLLTVLSLPAQDDSAALTGEPFRVALTGRYPPFSFYGSEGQIQGFDVDTAREVGRRLGRPTEIIAIEWAGIIPGLQANRYDAIIGSMAITPEREKQVLFSRPYYVSGAQLFVKGKDADKFPNIDAFKDELIGVGIGSTYEQYVTRNYPNLNVQMYPGESDMFQDMRSGRLSGFVTDRLVGMYNAEQAGEDFVPVGDLLYRERCAIPVTLNNKALHQQINAALDAMEADGFFEQLHIKWFGKALDTADADAATDIADMRADQITIPVIARIMLIGFMYTCIIAAAAIIVGFILAIPIGVGIHSGPTPVRWILIGFSDIIRGTPVLVQLFFIYYGLGNYIQFSPLQAGIIAMTINAAAYMGEVVRSGLMSVQPGQVTGALAIGLTRIQAFRHVIWPQAFRIMVPPLMNSVVGLLKDTALVSVIGVAEVVTQTNKLASITFRPLELWFVVGLLFFLVAFPLMKAAQVLEDRMRRKGYQMEK